MFKHRPNKPEKMDGPDFGPREAAAAFRFLKPVNRLFGGIRPGLVFLQRESIEWEQGQTRHLLDVGCGIGDASVAMVRWARKQGYQLHIDAIDKNPSTIDLARRHCRDYPEISLACQDVFQLHSRNYDYVHASQFLHHFSDKEVPFVLRHLLTLSRRKVVINDLIRAPLHYLATWLVTLPPVSAVSRHDARLSVRKGFIPWELAELLQKRGLNSFRLETHFFYRFLLIMSK